MSLFVQSHKFSFYIWKETITYTPCTKTNLDLFFSCSLEELGPENKQDNVVLAFQQLAEEFGEKFRKQFDYDI